MAFAQARIARSTLALVIVASLAFCTTARVRKADQELPQQQGFVSDFAGKLSSDTKQNLEALLKDFADRSDIELAVVTLPYDQMNGLPVEEYSLNLGRKWGIGRGPQKLGLLLLIAIQPPDGEGRYHGATRLEVSRNLEADISNDLAAEIIRTMRGDFVLGKLDRAITEGVGLILSTLSRKREIPDRKKSGSH